MPRVLVLAIGNPLRSDDGVAWHVADRLRRSALPFGVEIIAVHQLTPELAEDLSRAELAIFVDAAQDGQPGTARCQRITTSETESAFSHRVSPAALLQLAKSLYNAAPKAFLVSVAGRNFDHGDSLSPEVQRGVPKCAGKVLELIASGPSG